MSGRFLSGPAPEQTVLQTLCSCKETLHADTARTCLYWYEALFFLKPGVEFGTALFGDMDCPAVRVGP